jgi:hypothetical protein
MDPVTMALMAGGSIAENMYSQSKADKRLDDFSKKIKGLGDEMQKKYDSMFTLAESFAPGGASYRRGLEQAVDTSFAAANQGIETAASKGINMTSAGTSVFTDIVKDDFTKGFMDNESEMAKIGLGYAGTGANIMGDYTNLMSSAASAEFAATDTSSPFGDLLDIGMMYMSSKGK